MFPRGRKLILGIGGGISAYKSCDLIRRLQENGFVITVVPTKSSLNFVGEATWAALSGNKVYTDLWRDVEQVPHISLAKESDAIIIAPATADLIARIANGRADDLLTNIVLASTKPKVLVPAMHPEMWLNEATVSNVKTLRERGFLLIEPDFGKMTGSDVGIGRYPETNKIIDALDQHLVRNADLLGRKILITAGGTREPIDPVRFIGNRSSGKQGFALALAAANRGAEVHLITANTDLPSIDGITTTYVETAAQMSAVLKHEFEYADALIMSAAVADFKISNSSAIKIHKNQIAELKLEANEDILISISKLKKSNQITVGFAAETASSPDEISAAGRKKLSQKNLDLIYVNDVSNGAVFGADETSGVIMDVSGEITEVPVISKDTLSDILLDKILVKLG
ncbi:MAG: bifunctional phosphopantothenoylcysteine decarboxylase/phosphopantothenate--cysteine ligase CoaBC [Actinobacteria bacterium]|nr:bifunctional phosphopantothenoylcysteine decarboxylase/phosphopantothenate--cysteine ligase CoaBC [Actinomycetota bacterium]